MMNTELNTAIGVLRGTELGVVDAARLVMEGVEFLGEMAHGVSRAELVLMLRRVVQAGVEVVRHEELTVSLSEAAWASVEARSDLRATSLRDLRHFVRRILRVEGAAELPLRRISSAQCRSILARAFGKSRSSYVKGRAILHSIFAYGIRREWCSVNPVSHIEVPKVKERFIKPLALDEVRRLLRVAKQPEHQDMLFSLCLLLYGGVRPAEVSRLRAEDVCWEEKRVIIRPQSSKTGGGRMVHLHCMHELKRELCVVPRNWERRWRELRRAAGFPSWVADVCRHTFASYHAAHFRNLAALQLEMGHRSASLLGCRYVVPVPPQLAAWFWRLR